MSESFVGAGWRSIKEAAPGCTSCRHSGPDTMFGGTELLLCNQAGVRAVYERDRVAATMARAEVCQARLWQAVRR